jgi:hypothetical protein
MVLHAVGGIAARLPFFRCQVQRGATRLASGATRSAGAACAFRFLGPLGGASHLEVGIIIGADEMQVES